MHYEASRHTVDAAEDNETLRQVYKEFAVLLRAVYALIRTLPAQSVRGLPQHRLTPPATSDTRRCGFAIVSQLAQRPASGLSFQVLPSHPRTMPSPKGHTFGDVQCDEHDFSPIRTPSGKFFLGVKFREDLSFAVSGALRCTVRRAVVPSLTDEPAMMCGCRTRSASGAAPCWTTSSQTISA